MILQKQPNPWSCAVTAFAMAYNVSVDELISRVGHDGSEILFPEDSEPYCRRGFHFSELVLQGLLMGFKIITLQVEMIYPNYLMSKTKIRQLENWGFLLYDTCVLGVNQAGHNHMVAWDGREVFDPRGVKEKIDKYHIEEIYHITFQNSPKLALDNALPV